MSAEGLRAPRHIKSVGNSTVAIGDDDDPRWVLTDEERDSIADVISGYPETRHIPMNALYAAVARIKVQERGAALREAASEVNIEARWHVEMSGRAFEADRIPSSMKHDYAAERLLVVERILRDRAATSEPTS